MNGEGPGVQGFEGGVQKKVGMGGRRGGGGKALKGGRQEKEVIVGKWGVGRVEEGEGGARLVGQV